MKHIKLIALLAVVIFLGACRGIRTGTSGGKNTYYTSFFVSENVMQYFLRPLEYKGDKITVLIDFTLRDTISANGLVVSNFTVQSNENTFSTDSVYFKGDSWKSGMTDLNTLFTEKEKNEFLKRYTGNISYTEFGEICQDPDHKIYLYNGPDQYAVSPSRKARKNLASFKRDILFLINSKNKN